MASKSLFDTLGPKITKRIYEILRLEEDEIITVQDENKEANLCLLGSTDPSLNNLIIETKPMVRVFSMPLPKNIFMYNYRSTPLILFDDVLIAIKSQKGKMVRVSHSSKGWMISSYSKIDDKQSKKLIQGCFVKKIEKKNDDGEDDEIEIEETSCIDFFEKNFETDKCYVFLVDSSNNAILMGVCINTPDDNMMFRDPRPFFDSLPSEIQFPTFFDGVKKHDPKNEPVTYIHPFNCTCVTVGTERTSREDLIAKLRAGEEIDEDEDPDGQLSKQWKDLVNKLSRAYRVKFFDDRTIVLPKNQFFIIATAKRQFSNEVRKGDGGGRKGDGSKKGTGKGGKQQEKDGDQKEAKSIEDNISEVLKSSNDRQILGLIGSFETENQQQTE